MGRDIADTAGTVLLVVGVTALLLPALFPVQPVLYHEVGAGTTANGTELETDGYTVVTYENLSERGQEIYVAALRSSSYQYTVPAGEGAPAFPYTAANELEDGSGSEAYERRQRRTSIVIERPADADLPPPREPVSRAEYELEKEQAAADGSESAEQDGAVNRSRLEQRRQTIATYDLVTVRKGAPPLTDTANLSRLGAVLVGAAAVGVGGYLRSRP